MLREINFFLPLSAQGPAPRPAQGTLQATPGQVKALIYTQWPNMKRLDTWGLLTFMIFCGFFVVADSKSDKYC